MACDSEKRSEWAGQGSRARRQGRAMGKARQRILKRQAAEICGGQQTDNYVGFTKNKAKRE